MENTMYAVIDVLNDAILFESFDYQEILTFVNKHQADYTILDVAVIK